MDPLQMLANAIVIQAAKDYRTALRHVRRKPDSKTARAEVSELERFFRSEWYRYLTNVNGEALMKKLKEETGV